MRNQKVVFILSLILFVCFFGYSNAQIPDYTGSSIRPDTASSIILIGDVQLRGTPEILLGRENNKDAVRTLLKKIAEEDPSFVLVLGDFTFHGSSVNSWSDFDDMAKAIHEKGIPIFPLPGNHEYFGNPKEGFHQYFLRFPQIQHKLWYVKKWKDVGIITLNANFNHLSKEQITKQNTWYNTQMDSLQADTTVAIIIVCCHEPPYTNSTVVSDDKEVQKHFVPSYLSKSKAKLFFSGHCHSYEHFHIGGKDFVVSGGAGPRQMLEAPPKDSPKKDLFHGGPERKHHFCKLTRTNDGLHVQMMQVSENLKKWSIGEEIVISSK